MEHSQHWRQAYTEFDWERNGRLSPASLLPHPAAFTMTPRTPNNVNFTSHRVPILLTKLQRLHPHHHEMPTYYATGVTATLSTCDLQPTLSQDIHLRQGATLQANAKRVQDALSAADNLPERPLCIDASHSGVVQFIGEHGDMPFYMVEAGAYLLRNPRDGDVVMHGSPCMNMPARLRSSETTGSPLTSLATTPPLSQQAFRQVAHSSRPSFPHAVLSHPSSLPDSSLTSKAHAKALVLEVAFSQKSFLLDIARPRITAKGYTKALKIEVFVNGQLSDVSLVHSNAERRRAPGLVDKEKACFAGFRIHRQVEKPWIYSSSSPSEPSTGNPDTIWQAVRASYMEEADVRGRNDCGDAPPSADFLRALSKLDLPNHMQHLQNIGVVDVIITVGEGRKHGPDTPYIMHPSRLEDPAYKKQQEGDSKGPLGTVSETEATTTTALVDIHMNGVNDSSPKRTAHTDASSPSRKRTIDFASLGFDVDPTTIVARHETTRGSPSKQGKTLLQRLGDLKKMNDKNQDKELHRLRQELAVHVPAAKRLKIDDKMDMDFESYLAADTGSVLPSRHTPRPARKTTQASALAHSPTSVPVKIPKARGLATSLQRRTQQPDDPNVPHPHHSGPVTTTKPAVAPTGIVRNAKSWAKDTVDAALMAFEVPDACKGSSIGYDADVNVARQIGKARGGEFREHSLLVGMRFVVL